MTCERDSANKQEIFELGIVFGWTYGVKLELGILFGWAYGVNFATSHVLVCYSRTGMILVPGSTTVNKRT